MVANICKLVVVLYFTSTACSALLSPRILNGTNANVGQFPYQALIYVDGEFQCGGSIISPNYVLTAAHCVFKEDHITPYGPNSFELRLGSIQRMAGGILIGVQEVKSFPGYGDMLGDIALLKLNTILTFNDKIQMIKLNEGEVPVGAPVVISGWGRLSFGGKNPHVLQFSTSKAIDTETCVKSGILNYGYEKVICLAREQGHGSCNGDSGGPATFDGKLVGVCSFSHDGCGSDFPDAFVKVSYYHEWIVQNMV